MPLFPRYESKGQLTTQQPSAGAVSSTEAQVTEQGAKVGQAIQQTSEKWTAALDTIQKTTALANFKSGLLDIQTRAQNDPNYNNSDQYHHEIEKLKNDNLKGFASKTAATEMGIQLDYESKVGKIQLDNAYKKKIIDVGQMSSLKLIDAEINNPTESSLNNIKSELNKQVQAGIFDHKAAYQLYRKANDDLGVNRISKDLYQAQTPEQVDLVTQGITSGEYEKGGVVIPPDKKKDLLDVAERAKKNAELKIKAQQTEALAKNRVDTIAGLASGKLSFNDINLTQISESDPQLASTLAKVKDFMVDYNPKLSPQQQALSSAGMTSVSKVMAMKAYARSITDTFLHSDNEKLSEFVMRELEKKGDGLTPSVKIAAFANLAYLKARANNPQTPEDAAAGNKLQAIRAGVAYLEASNPYLAPSAIGEFIVRNFLSGASTHEQVMSDAKAALKDKVIEMHKGVVRLSSMPNKVVDGDASVEDLHSGMNELKGEKYVAPGSDASSKK